MTPADREKAEYAKLMLQSDVFAEALTEIRNDALLALAEIKADDMLGIVRQQAIVAVTGEIVASLKAKMTAAGSMDGGFDQNSDQE